MVRRFDNSSGQGKFVEAITELMTELMCTQITQMTQFKKEPC